MGIKLPSGDVSYHLPMTYWEFAKKSGAQVLEFGNAWDGHTSTDVILRLKKFFYSPAEKLIAHPSIEYYSDPSGGSDSCKVCKHCRKEIR